MDGGGWVKLRSLSGNYYTENTDVNNLAARVYVFNVSTEDDYTRFRIINADIRWSLTDRGIKFNQPVLPPASELQFQLFTSQFQGIATQTGADFVDFTVRGATVVDRMLEVETRVSEIAGACN